LQSAHPGSRTCTQPRCAFGLRRRRARRSRVAKHDWRRQATVTPLRACLDCGRPCRSTRCHAHTRDHGYADTHWQTIRKQRLLLDGHACTFKYDGCSKRATSVHLDPRCHGNHALATLDNTRSACAHCHGVEDGPRANGYNATSATHPPGAGSARRAPRVNTTPLCLSQNVRLSTFCELENEGA
jgi:hypothetical protein